MIRTERIWKINGLELELDLEDADVFEKTMKAFEQMDEDGRNIVRQEKCQNLSRDTARFITMHLIVFSEKVQEKKSLVERKI